MLELSRFENSFGAKNEILQISRDFRDNYKQSVNWWQLLDKFNSNAKVLGPMAILDKSW